MSLLDQIQPISKEMIPVRLLLKAPIQWTQLTGEIGLDNVITDKSLHRPQLALAGFVGLFTFHRVQIFGNTEIYFPNYAGSAAKSWSNDGVAENNSTQGTAILSAGLQTATTAISSITIGNYTTPDKLAQYTTAYLYGIKNS